MAKEPPMISSFHFPPGVRFHPSDEELIRHYLLNKVKSCPLPAAIVAEIELYNYDPWELPELALFGEDEWFFFSPRDRKYPNGIRPNRTATSGYWKPTGSDKPILGSDGSRIGVKKPLVFYEGKAPSGRKTEWNMMEYRLPNMAVQPARETGSMRLDDWVLCHVRKKGNMSKNATWKIQPSPQGLQGYLPKNEELPSVNNPVRDVYSNNWLTKDHSPLIYSMIIQGLIPIENIARAASQFHSDDNYVAVYEHIPGKENIHIANSCIQSSFDSSKKKQMNWNGHQNLHNLAMTSVDGTTMGSEDFLSENMIATNGNQPQADIFSVIQYQMP